jgi:NAD(P)H:quinone oxidoreductase type IV
MTIPVVYIVIYSLYHHVYKLSLSIKEGLESKGVDVKVFQVQETLSDEILTKMQAPPKPDLPVITIDQLVEADGVLFGLPTRFGTMPAQVKALLDASGSLWAKGSLAGKFAGTFFSTASQHGGQETTALTAVTYFAHHGMMYVPFGYANMALYNLNEVVGGSPYGSGTVSDGDGSRQPTELELGIAKNQGANFANTVTIFVRGRDMADSNIPATITAAPESNATPTNATATDGAAPIASSVAGGAASAAGGAVLASDGSAPATTTTAADGTAAITDGGVTGQPPSETGIAAGATAAGAAAATAGVAATLGSKGKEAATTGTTDRTTPGATTTDDTAAGNAAEPSATDIGTAAGAQAADNAAATKPNAVKESIVNKAKEKKPKKKKWFCCG